MKKNILLGLLCGSLVLGLATGCGNQSNNENNNPNINSTQNNSSSKNYQIADDLNGTLEVNLSTTKYCLNTPDFTSRASSGYINNMNGYFIISDQYVDPATKIEYGIDYTTIKNSNDIIDIMKPQFIANAKNIGGLNYIVKIVQTSYADNNGGGMAGPLFIDINGNMYNEQGNLLN